MFTGIGFSILIGGFIGIIKIPRLFALIWGGIFGGISWNVLVYPALKPNPMSLVAYGVGILCVAVLMVFIKGMPKRTSFGSEMLGKLKGFKRFLETAEKEQLEALVNENPEYFYNILPYTYALGVSNVWMKQFETIAMKAPDWYDASGSFDAHDFNNFMNSTMSSARSAMASSPSSGGGSSGGSFSGGGSSGGGSGGGGGGSW